MAVKFPNAPTDLGINTFRGIQDGHGGPAKIARFMVQVRPIGSNVLSSKPYFNKIADLKYACYQAEYPGKGFDTLTARYYGPPQVFPVNSKYGTSVLTFICHNSSLERQVFDDWQDAINNTNNFNFAYPETYYADIVIYHFSEEGNSTSATDGGLQLNYAWSLRKAWPSLIRPQPVTWMDTDFLFLEVEFTYRFWDRDPAAGKYSGDTNPAAPRPSDIQ